MSTFFFKKIKKSCFFFTKVLYLLKKIGGKLYGYV
nr:MAG TPA: hypothetical protein [Caudoviricetes sp.]